MSAGYLPHHTGINPGMKDEMTARAAELYARVCLTAQVKRFFSWLTGRNRRLLHLEDTLGHHSLEAGSYMGTRAVEIDHIRGSESRGDDFDAEMLPVRETTRERWLRVASAVLCGEELPPVELIQVGSDYYIRDGHHRVSVAHSLGRHFIDADIIQIRKLPM